MKKIIAKTLTRDYPIIIDHKVMAAHASRTASMVKNMFIDSEKIVFITNEKILSIYKKEIDEFLSATCVENRIISLPDGEKEKNLNSVEKIYHELLDFNIHRNDLIVAFGGGVIGDTAGFAASTFHRGIRLIHFPTTIISQVDSSIGGKVVVNLHSFKNIIGSFYQPHAVIIDTDLLSTLEEKEIINGFAEVLKYGIVFDIKIIDQLLAITNKTGIEDCQRLFKIIQHNDFIKIIYRCCKIKAEIVQKDEYDTGVRNLLNFGHTFGHAIEKITGLKDINHGMAVAIGMVLAVDVSIKLGLAKPQLSKDLKKLYSLLKLPDKLPRLDTGKFMEVIKSDKKFTARKNKFILLKGINRPLFYYDVDENIIEQALKENMM